MAILPSAFRTFFFFGVKWSSDELAFMLTGVENPYLTNRTFSHNVLVFVDKFPELFNVGFAFELVAFKVM